MSKFVPHGYQKKIIDFILNNKRGAVWAGMGMGKTVSTLTAIAELIKAGKVHRVLVIAPLRVACSTWPSEVKKWNHLKHLKVAQAVGVPTKRLMALRGDAEIVTINYENLIWLEREFFRIYGWPFDMIVCDESTRLKGFRMRQGTRNARSLARVAHGETERFIELTGTPAPNGLQDLWGQMWFVDRGVRLWPTYRGFLNRWFTPHRVGANAFAVKWEPISGAERDIEEKLSGVVVKVNPEDWFDIEKPIVSDVCVDLTKEAARLYRQMEEEFYADLASGEIVEAANAAVKSAKCLQIASGALYTSEDRSTWSVIHDAKMEALESIVEEASGMPVLVSYSFKHEVARILKHFPNARVLDKDPQTIADWNAGKIPMLLAHPASCGHGLNLQDGGNILVFFSCGWNLEHHDQIIERIGPMRQRQAGHARPVFLYYIRANETLDEVVKERLETKREVMDILLEKVKNR